VAASPWKSILVVQPADLDEVWIRRIWINDPPVLAVWDAGAQEFTTSDTSTVIPGWFVWQWRPQ